MAKNKSETPGMKLCRHCQSEIPEAAKVCPNCRKKQGRKGLVALLVVVIIIVVIVVAALASSGDGKSPASSGSTGQTSAGTGQKEGTGSGASDQEPEKEYVPDDQIQDLFTDPGQFKGKYVKLTGRIFTEPEKDGGDYYIQAFQDIQNYENSFVALIPEGSMKEGVPKNDMCIRLEGLVDGTMKGTNAFGGSISAPKIIASECQTISYVDAAVPAIKKIKPKLTEEEHGFAVTLTKVEYAKEETRLYLTAKNDSDEAVSIYSYDAKIVMGDKQYEPDAGSSTLYESDLEEFGGEILPGIKQKGCIVFPAIDSDQAFTLRLDSPYSENFNISFSDYVFQVEP